MSDTDMLKIILEKVTSLNNRVSSLENELKSIKLTLENATNRNIHIIAEGHIEIKIN